MEELPLPERLTPVEFTLLPRDTPVEADEPTRVLLGRVYALRLVEEASVRVVTPLRVPDERVPTTRLVVVAPLAHSACKTKYPKNGQ